jgi:hypothetical protein
MASNPHPQIALCRKTTRDIAKNAVCAVVYAPESERATWITKELEREDISIQTTRGVSEVIAALIDEPAPRPQILVIDFDALHPAELLELHTVRDQGWCGTIFALGKVPVGLRKSLRIEQVIDTQRENALRNAVGDVGFDAKTRRLPIFAT